MLPNIRFTSLIMIILQMVSFESDKKNERVKQIRTKNNYIDENIPKWKKLKSKTKYNIKSKFKQYRSSERKETENEQERTVEIRIILFGYQNQKRKSKIISIKKYTYRQPPKNSVSQKEEYSKKKAKKFLKYIILIDPRIIKKPRNNRLNFKDSKSNSARYLRLDINTIKHYSERVFIGWIGLLIAKILFKKTFERHKRKYSQNGKEKVLYNKTKDCSKEKRRFFYLRKNLASRIW